MARSCSNLHLEPGSVCLPVLLSAGSQKENANHTPQSSDSGHLRNRYAMRPHVPKMAITHGNVQKWMYRISCLALSGSLFAKLKDATAVAVAATLFPYTFHVEPFFLCLCDVIWRRNLFSASSVIKHCQMQQVEDFASHSGALLILPLCGQLWYLVACVSCVCVCVCVWDAACHVCVTQLKPRNVSLCGSSNVQSNKPLPSKFPYPLYTVFTIAAQAIFTISQWNSLNLIFSIFSFCNFTKFASLFSTYQHYCIRMKTYTYFIFIN